MDEDELERLRRSEQSYRNLAECSIQAIFVHDDDGHPLYANPAFARMLGYRSPGELLALDFSADPLVAPHERERLARFTRARLAGEHAPAEYEFDALTRDGSIRRLRAQISSTDWRASPAVLATMVDVTEQRTAEARFRTLVEGSIHGIGILDLDWRPLFVNTAYATLFGYDHPEQILALESIEPLVEPGDFERMRRCARVRGAGGDVPEIDELHGVCRDGTRRPLLSTAHRIEWDGRTAFQVTLTDLTELRIAERALHESEHRLAESIEMLRVVLDTIPDLVYWKDLQGRFLGCNASFARDAGRASPADLIGCTDHDMRWRQDAEKYRADDAQVCETGVPMLGFEEQQTRPDASQAWLRTWKVPLRNAAGDIIGLLGTSRHITEEKHAQEALRASEERYALAVRGSTDGIWDWDLERDAVYYSPRLREIAGFAPGRQFQNSEQVFDTIHEDDREAFRAAMAAHLRGETGVFRLEFRIRGDDGAERWVLDRGVALRNRDGRAHRMAGSVVDIGEQREADEELARYRDRLEELVSERTDALRAAQADLLRAERLAALGELTAAVSHELRNPLGTIHASFETLRRRSPTDDETSQRALQRIDRNIGRCVKIIEELLGYARLREPVRREVRLDDVVATLLAHRACGRGIALDADLDCGVRVAVDEELIRIALDNVLRNAEQALESGGAGRIAISTRTTDDGAEITIGDDGPGIEPATHERIFEPLFSTRSFGVGLGLPIAQHILEQHGGWIDIAATGPAGTTVLLWLPDASPGG